MVAAFVSHVLANIPIVHAWKRAALGRFSMRTGYRWWSRIRRAQVYIRSALMQRGPAPECNDSRSIAQMMAHLGEQVPARDYEQFAAFQERFQIGLVP